MATPTYMLIVDLFDPDINIKSIQAYIKDCRHFHSWWNYMPGVFMFDSDRSIPLLNLDFQNFFQTNSQYLLLEVTPFPAAGQLPQAAWNWLNAHQEPTVSGLLPNLPNKSE